ncbi:MAG: hypothetical protein LBS76_00060, partial [Mycoplasmataceae bacterium]|nr:hypothetical protein [Mycoplasmataceae bacterium]
YITSAGSNQTISGTFAISSASSTAYGVVFSITAAGSTQTISGTFTISSASSTAIGVYLSAAISGNITISGTFTISSTSSCSGVYFYGYEGASINGNTTISGTFAISSASSTAYGVFFRTTASCTLTMVGSQFFSNQVDSGNIFTIYPSDDADHNYKWNGAEMTSDSHSSSADETLALVSVSDQLPNPNFTIKAINTAGVDGSKATFNTTYKNALSVYATSVDCPATAKPWLMSIIGQIPTT